MLNRLRNLKALLGLAVLGTVACLSTGCMVTPGNHQLIGDKSNPVEVSGYTLEPNKWVRIQARKPGQANWTHMGWAKTGNSPINYYGTNWYLYSKDIVVPNQYWLNTGGEFVIHQTQLRVISHPDGEPMYNFKGDFYGNLADHDTLLDLWEEEGNNKEYVTIQGF